MKTRTEVLTTALMVGLTGKDLKRLRRARGVNQSEMGRMIGIGRHSVSYWECKPAFDLKWPYRGRPLEMLTALGYDLPIFVMPMRARGDGVLVPHDEQRERLDRLNEARLKRLLEQGERRRQRCNATTRKGHPCKLMSEPGRTRCKFHGGMSTGPKTAEGKARIAEAQRKRWADYRRNQKKLHSKITQRY